MSTALATPLDTAQRAAASWLQRLAVAVTPSPRSPLR